MGDHCALESGGPSPLRPLQRPPPLEPRGSPRLGLYSRARRAERDLRTLGLAATPFYLPRRPKLGGPACLECAAASALGIRSWLASRRTRLLRDPASWQTAAAHRAARTRSPASARRLTRGSRSTRLSAAAEGSSGFSPARWRTGTFVSPGWECSRRPRSELVRFLTSRADLLRDP